MRRFPAPLWLFAPLVVGLLYVAAYALLAPEPRLSNLAPPEAILVQRFRDLDTLDRVSFGPRGPRIPPARELVAKERNVPGLPGVDAHAPVHLMILPQGNYQDATLAVFRVDDPERFRRAFMRTDFLERKLIRNAQFLHIRGGWAAVGPRADVVRRIGMGTLACKDLGEDYALAARVPPLVDYAMGAAKTYPWRGILQGLGLRPGDAKLVRMRGTDELRAVIPGAERASRIREAWKTARLWGWMDAGRIRVDLEPGPGPVAEALAARKAARGSASPVAGDRPDIASPPDAPAGALAWLRVPQDYDRPLLAHVLRACGMRFVQEEKGMDPLGGLAAPVPPRQTRDERGFLMWATRGIGTGFAWTVGIAASHGDLPPLAGFLPRLPTDGKPTLLPAGEAPLTKGDTTTDHPTPAGMLAAALDVPSQHAPGTFDVVTFGPSAREALEGMRNQLGLPEAARREDLRAAWDPGEGMEPLATFFLRADRARSILGRALEPGGFLAPLDGGDIRGALYTDGRILRLLLWRQ